MRSPSQLDKPTSFILLYTFHSIQKWKVYKRMNLGKLNIVPVSFRDWYNNGMLSFDIPVCMPIRSLSVSFGLCDILWLFTAFSNSSAIEAISPTCLSLFRIGSPDTWSQNNSKLYILRHELSACLSSFSVFSSFVSEFWPTLLRSTNSDWRSYYVIKNSFTEPLQRSKYLKQKKKLTNVSLHSTYHHIGIPNSLHLINVVASYNPIEHRVQIVEKVDHLQRRAFRRHGGEADDIAEVNSDGIKGFRLHALAGCEATGDWPATKRWW